MYETNTDKVMMVCMIMIKIYVVNGLPAIKKQQQQQQQQQKKSDIYSREPAMGTLKV